MYGTIISAVIGATCGALAGCLSQAKNDADKKVHSRDFQITDMDCLTDKNGQKCITVWARKAVHIPFLPADIIYVHPPAPEIYELAMTNGIVNITGYYERIRKGLTVTDRYIRFEEKGGTYAATCSPDEAGNH